MRIQSGLTHLCVCVFFVQVLSFSRPGQSGRFQHQNPRKLCGPEDLHPEWLDYRGGFRPRWGRCCCYSPSVSLHFYNLCAVYLRPVVGDEYPVHELRCHAGLPEADFLKLLGSTFPQLASSAPFDSLIPDGGNRLQPLEVESFTPEQICRAAGNSALYLRLKVPHPVRKQKNPPDSASFYRPLGPWNLRYELKPYWGKISCLLVSDWKSAAVYGDERRLRQLWWRRLLQWRCSAFPASDSTRGWVSEHRHLPGCWLWRIIPAEIDNK